MCGIWGLIKKRKSLNRQLQNKWSDFYNLKHRGPDNSCLWDFGQFAFGFHRLAIVGNKFNSNQPIFIEDDTRTVISICNGEIYNYKE